MTDAIPHGGPPLEALLQQLEACAAGTRPTPTDLLPETNIAVDLIRNELVAAARHGGAPETFRTLLESQQAALTGWIDRVSVLAGKAMDSSELEANAVGMKMILIDGLQSLQALFPGQFSDSFLLPQSLAQSAAKDFSNRWDALRDQPPWEPESTEWVSLDQTLRVFLQPVKKISLSYQQIRYLDQWIDLFHLEQNLKSSSVLTRLQQFTVQTNFNDPRWFTACADQVQHALDPFGDPLERWQQVQAYLKAIAQCPSYGMAFDLRQPSLSEQLTGWLRAEADFLEKMSLRTSLSTPASSKKDPPPPVSCTLTVDQLGLFFRASKDAGFLKTASLKSLFDRVAPALRTPGREVLSADSMRSKSYSPERKDIHQLKEVLMQVSRQLNDY